MERFETILDITDRFRTKKACLDYLEKIMYPNGICCPHCTQEKVYRYKSGVLFKCSECSRQFSVTTGTIFHGTHIALRKWILAIYLFTTNKSGLSSRQLARDINVTVKSAWFLLHRVRYAISRQTFARKMRGTVTIDEAMWGQRSHNMHYHLRPKSKGRKGENKLKIFTMVETDGRVKSILVPNFASHTLNHLIIHNVQRGTTILSDEFVSYKELKHVGYNHLRCDHGNYEYVSASGATTNKCENYFSFMKKIFHGAYVKMTAHHIQKYLSETDFRFTTRNYTEHHRFNLALSLGRVRLTYNQLIGKHAQ